MNNKKIYLSPPHMSGKEREYVKNVFDSNWIAPLGPQVDAFENDLSRYIGMKHTAVLSSGTAAIHLALIMLGVKKEDRVLCSSFTFSGSANPIIYQNAIPVFIDSEKDTWNMDPELMEKAIKEGIKKNKKPKAIIPVHLYGMPAKLDEILELSRQYEIPIIEDAAEAMGSEYQNRKAGSFGDLSILSFNGNKIITTSGGGALLSNNKEYIEKTKFLATQARDKAPHYQHSHIGYNYRMSNVLAGIGRGQLEVIDERVKTRRRINEWYREIFKEADGIEFLTEPNKDYFSNYWLTTIIIDKTKTDFSNEDLRLAFNEANIESRPLWKPMHLQPVFEKYPSFINGTSEHLFKNGLCLPSGSNLTEDDKKRIEQVLRKHI